jgi:hypothetical protein
MMGRALILEMLGSEGITLHLKHLENVPKCLEAFFKITTWVGISFLFLKF